MNLIKFVSNNETFLRCHGFKTIQCTRFQVIMDKIYTVLQTKMAPKPFSTRCRCLRPFCTRITQFSGPIIKTKIASTKFLFWQRWISVFLAVPLRDCGVKQVILARHRKPVAFIIRWLTFYRKSLSFVAGRRRLWRLVSLFLVRLHLWFASFGHKTYQNGWVIWNILG